MSNILIVYYSRKGQNYWAGSIRNLTKGNTEAAAEFIQKAVGGDMFEIETVQPYAEALHLDAVVDRLANYGTDGRVHARRIAAGSQDADALYLCHFSFA